MNLKIRVVDGNVYSDLAVLRNGNFSKMNSVKHVKLLFSDSAYVELETLFRRAAEDRFAVGVISVECEMVDQELHIHYTNGMTIDAGDKVYDAHC